jgi:hypothetical protein
MPLAGRLSSMNIMTVVAALRLNHVKMYYKSLAILVRKEA